MEGRRACGGIWGVRSQADKISRWRRLQRRKPPVRWPGERTSGAGRPEVCALAWEAGPTDRVGNGELGIEEEERIVGWDGGRSGRVGVGVGGLALRP